MTTLWIQCLRKTRRTKMKMSDTYVNDQLSKAQALLWSGSLHEVDEAHNIISKLIGDRVEQTDLS